MKMNWLVNCFFLYSFVSEHVRWVLGMYETLFRAFFSQITDALLKLVNFSSDHQQR